VPETNTLAFLAHSKVLEKKKFYNIVTRTSISPQTERKKKSFITLSLHRLHLRCDKLEHFHLQPSLIFGGEIGDSYDSHKKFQ
jgi:hypothetical protein